MSLHECNIPVGNLAYSYLGHAIEHGQVMGSHMSFSAQCPINKGGHVVYESNIGLSPY